MFSCQYDEILKNTFPFDNFKQAKEANRDARNKSSN